MFAMVRLCLQIFDIWPNPHISLSNIRWPSVKFIIIISTISLYVSVPQIMNVKRAWGNVTRMVEPFISVFYSMLAVFKLLVTWYHNKSKLIFRDNIKEINSYRQNKISS